MTRLVPVQDFPLWDAVRGKRVPLSFEIELTARCGNDCRHCYINLPASDHAAAEGELGGEEVLALGREAVGMGALWCLLTGGEPLLREDFEEVYVGLKRLGLLVSVFTNACLVTPVHVDLFRRYPPRDLEVTVYGVTRETYEAVTRRPGSFAAFTHGLGLLLEAGLPVRLKAMALRSNLHELDAIGRFCRERTKDYYRLDPLLHRRCDGDPARNGEIGAERLTPAEIVAVEQADPARVEALRRGCREGILQRPDVETGDGHESERLFFCGAGEHGFTISWDGRFRLCGSLCHPATELYLRAGAGGSRSLPAGALRRAWEEWAPRVRELRGAAPAFLEQCGRCGIVNLCQWCPATAALETGDLDGWVEYFCEVAYARAAAFGVVPGSSVDVAPGTVAP